MLNNVLTVMLHQTSHQWTIQMRGQFSASGKSFESLQPDRSNQFHQIGLSLQTTDSKMPSSNRIQIVWGHFSHV